MNGISPINKRWLTESRHCRWYYGDRGCLDLAALRDLPVVPCRECRSRKTLGIWPEYPRRFYAHA